MNQATVKLRTLQPASLVVVKDRKDYEQQVNHLSGITWQIAYTALWNGETFSIAEKDYALAAIRQFISQEKNPMAAFSEITERIILAKLYIQFHNLAYAPIPSRWFNASNTKGFAGTAGWYSKLVELRKSMPLHRIQIKAFGEAVFETVQSGSARDYHYWRSYFITQTCHGLANLFCSTMANYKFMQEQ